LSLRNLFQTTLDTLRQNVILTTKGFFMLPALSSLSLQLTDACNLACSYCYFAEKEPIRMSDDIVDRALALLLNESNPVKSRWHINLFGGEPTLFLDQLENVCQKATLAAQGAGRQIDFSMTTNGTRFDQKALDICQKYQISTMLSLDGNKQAHDRYRVFHNGRGSFDRIIKNLPFLKQTPNFKVRMTISVEVLPHLADSIEAFVEHGIESIGSSVVAEDEWSEAEYDLFEEQWLRVAAIQIRARSLGKSLYIKGLSGRQSDVAEQACRQVGEFGCGAATSFVFVDAKGDLYPCHRFPGYFNKSDAVKIGSVWDGLHPAKRAVFVDANRASAKTGCSAFVSTKESRGACSGCAIQGACGGACMAINQNATGDPRSPPPVIGRIEQIKLAIARAVNDYDGSLNQKILRDMEHNHV
jgi:uncharacterized protein